MNWFDVPAPTLTGKVHTVVDGKRVGKIPSNVKIRESQQDKKHAARMAQQAVTQETEVQPNTAISTEKVQQTAVHETKEMPVNSSHQSIGRGRQPSALNQALYNMILVTPGITKEELCRLALKDFPEETQKRIMKTLGNMVTVAQRITVVADGKNCRYHLNTQQKQPAQVKTKPVGNLVTGKEAAKLRADPREPVHVENDMNITHAVPANLSVEKYPALGSDGITIILDDKNNVCISLADQDMELSPEQTARLHAFMNRVQLAAV